MPNWKCASDYEYTSKLESIGWAWEFMRRNPEYRQDHQEVVETFQALPPSNGWIRRGGAARDVAAAHELAIRKGAKWGQDGPIADPASERAPDLFAFPIQPDGGLVDAFYCEPEPYAPIVQKPDYATLTFDLRRPLAPQLARAERLLKERQDLVGVIKAPHKGRELWPTYLRLLDALDAGSSTAEIIQNIEIYVSLDNTVESGYQAADRVSDHKKRATQLRDDPLSIIR